MVDWNYELLKDCEYTDSYKDIEEKKKDMKEKSESLISLLFLIAVIFVMGWLIITLSGNIFGGNIQIFSNLLNSWLSQF